MVETSQSFTPVQQRGFQSHETRYLLAALTVFALIIAVLLAVPVKSEVRAKTTTTRLLEGTTMEHCPVHNSESVGVFLGLSAPQCAVAIVLICGIIWLWYLSKQPSCNQRPLSSETASAESQSQTAQGAAQKNSSKDGAQKRDQREPTPPPGTPPASQPPPEGGGGGEQTPQPARGHRPAAAIAVAFKKFAEVITDVILEDVTDEGTDHVQLSYVSPKGWDQEWLKSEDSIWFRATMEADEKGGKYPVVWFKAQGKEKVYVKVDDDKTRIEYVSAKGSADSRQPCRWQLIHNDSVCSWIERDERNSLLPVLEPWGDFNLQIISACSKFDVNHGFKSLHEKIWDSVVSSQQCSSTTAGFENVDYDQQLCFEKKSRNPKCSVCRIVSKQQGMGNCHKTKTGSNKNESNPCLFLHARECKCRFKSIENGYLCPQKLSQVGLRVQVDCQNLWEFPTDVLTRIAVLQKRSSASSGRWKKLCLGRVGLCR
jgi:hypothetical protein